jgi:hypothetical protein
VIRNNETKDKGRDGEKKRLINKEKKLRVFRKYPVRISALLPGILKKVLTPYFTFALFVQL